MRAVGDAFSRSQRRERGEWISQSGFVKITMEHGPGDKRCGVACLLQSALSTT